MNMTKKVLYQIHDIIIIIIIIIHLFVVDVEIVTVPIN